MRDIQILARIQTPFGNTACLWEGDAEVLFEAPRSTRFRWIRGPGSILALNQTLEAGILGCERQVGLFGEHALSITQLLVLV